jgi:hypothetical protein
MTQPPDKQGSGYPGFTKNILKDLTATDVDPKILAIRRAMKATRDSLLATDGLDKTDYYTVIRIQPKGPMKPESPSCGCGCS